MTKKLEAPAFSMAILKDGKICIKVDEGKFMDSQYVYDELVQTPEGILQYKTAVQVLIVNGICRDALEIEHKFPEVQAEFIKTVTNTIIDELVHMLASQQQHEPEDNSPKIILQ